MNSEYPFKTGPCGWEGCVCIGTLRELNLHHASMVGYVCDAHFLEMNSPRTECTWEGCEKPGEIKQIATDGEVWAILCVEHNEIMDVGITSLKPKSFFANWIKAQGGAKIAAKRMMRK